MMVIVSQLLIFKPEKRVNEILCYLHLADNGILKQGGKPAKLRPFYDILNEKFLKYFSYV